MTDRGARGASGRAWLTVDTQNSSGTELVRLIQIMNTKDVHHHAMATTRKLATALTDVAHVGGFHDEIYKWCILQT